ncbi:MAG TPA: FecR family protein [bacterium]|nr:FecR family protein [bacterium]
MKRSIVCFAVAALVISACLTAYSEESKENPNKCDAYIAGIVGTVQYKEKEEDDWTKADLNMCIYVGDTIRTLKDSKAALQFGKSVQSRINALSTFTLKSIKPDDNKPNQLNLKVGQSWTKVTVKGTPFEVRTPTATAGVRGTEFDVSVDDEGGSKVNVLEGIVNVFNDLGEVLAEAGMATEILNGKIPDAPFKFNVEEYKKQLDSWKDQIAIGKILDIEEAIKQQKEQIQNNVKDVKNQFKKLKF